MQVGSLEMPVVDVDTHVIEPEDLWTSRMPKKWADDAPTVQMVESVQKLVWIFDDKPMFPALSCAHAGWRECTPNHPPTWEEANPATYDVQARVALMDEYGITVQVLYPNVAMFAAANLHAARDVELQNELVRAYNDWQHDWCSYAPERFAPMISLPFWDLDATTKEIIRCAERGFKGVIFSQEPAAFGQPKLVDPRWDPLWALCQELKLSVNFHIGSAFSAAEQDAIIRRTVGDLLNDQEAREAFDLNDSATGAFLANARTIELLIMGGICHRFPDLNFVSVESGAGYVRFVLELLDWLWTNTGKGLAHPDRLLPSEYFKRQIYGTFWFERESATHAIEALGSTNVMYETDFPHPNGMTPGPGAPGAVAPQQYVNETLDELEEDDLRNILYRNAARVYQLDGVLATT